jgi:type II secretory pathway predicted ATPase ExeA
MQQLVFLQLIYLKRRSRKMQNKLLSLYGLKYNPFASEVPEEALYPYPALENFCWRIENVLLREGGFALVSGDPGCGKSVALRLIASRLKPIRDVQIASITHPTARLSEL